MNLPYLVCLCLPVINLGFELKWAAAFVPQVLATSPQSTLCDAGIWSASSTGSPNICSKASPRLSAFQERRNDDAMDILYMAAGELLRRKQAEQRASERYQLKKPFVTTKSSSIAGSHNNQIVTRQQIQAAQVGL